MASKMLFVGIWWNVTVMNSWTWFALSTNSVNGSMESHSPLNFYLFLIRSFWSIFLQLLNRCEINYRMWIRCGLYFLNNIPTRIILGMATSIFYLVAVYRFCHSTLSYLYLFFWWIRFPAIFSTIPDVIFRRGPGTPGWKRMVRINSCIGRVIHEWTNATIGSSSVISVGGGVVDFSFRIHLVDLSGPPCSGISRNSGFGDLAIISQVKRMEGAAMLKMNLSLSSDTSFIDRHNFLW